MLRIFSVFMASFVLVFPPQNVSGEEPGFLIFGAGVYDMFDDKTTGEILGSFFHGPYDSQIVALFV